MPPVLQHTLAPVFNEHSRVLILGSFPSPLSRQTGFYYGHPQNRFWPVMAAVWNEAVPATPDERREFALRQRFALWDVIASCSIKGADDASIRDVVPNDMSVILSRADIRAVFTTGSKAYSLYKRYCTKLTGISPVLLPSTSPANCRYHTQSTLTDAYMAIRRCIEQ